MGCKPKKKIIIAPVKLEANPIISINLFLLCYLKEPVDIDSTSAYHVHQ